MNEIRNGMRLDEIYSAKLRALYAGYGYRMYKVNRFEEYDLYVQNKNFLTDERILTFTDLNGRLKALKPDITLSVVRNTRDEKLPVRICYAESAYRVPKGETEFHEIMQTGIEYIGTLNTLVMSEIVLLAGKSLQLISDTYSLEISHMGLIAEILECCGVGDQVKAVLEMLRRKDRHAVMNLAVELGLEEKKAKLLDTLVVMSGPLGESCRKLMAFDLSEKAKQILLEMMEMDDILGGVWTGCLNLDFSVLSDLGYYNGLVLSGFVEGIPVPVLSGGQYDPLLRRLGRTGQGIGFAVYLNQIDRCIREEKKETEQVQISGKADRKEAFAELERRRAHGEALAMMVPGGAE